ncbi:MAG: membrane dipeptidase [Clostridia bacterium]|nr:membrane dipeptidase [Clostridia bacterium]
MFTPETDYGLTDFGFSLVQEMNRLGMVVDVSHLSDKGFYDVLSVAKKPIVASHSNARGVCRNVRNLTDDMLKRLADNGGVTGINYAAGFLCENEQKGRHTIAYAVEHIRYIRDKVGADYIALGSDFDGIQNDIELFDCSQTPLLLQALEREKFTADEIEKIAYKNALRVFKENME